MANPFLNKTDLIDRDIETALLFERAIRHDIGNALAYTDGKDIFINTEDNLFNLLPAYDQRMLKWLLWHEKYHLELRHHNRFFKYLHELDEEETLDEFHVTKDEVNIIMDILVHDIMTKKFPELVDAVTQNPIQLRNRNVLSYTFKATTLEEMLDEYAKHKHGEDDGDGDSKGKDTKDGGKEGDKKEEDKPKKRGRPPKKKPETEKKGHSEGGEESPESKEEKPEIKDEESERPSSGDLPDEHDKTDWSKLDDIDNKEFITEAEGEQIHRAVAELKRKKLKFAKVTETLNSLVTSTRARTYAKPNPIKIGGGVVLKGSKPGRTQLYLIFDASGSMCSEMEMFKDIISKSIPQAMRTPCEWFAGCNAKIRPYKEEHGDGYFKGKFEDFLSVYAQSGYNDDGDRTIELCWMAEQLGYSPIGVTDGGGQISWSKDKLKQLKRTVFVGHSEWWLDEAKKINPRVQTLYV